MGYVALDNQDHWFIRIVDGIGRSAIAATPIAIILTEIGAWAVWKFPSERLWEAIDKAREDAVQKAREEGRKEGHEEAMQEIQKGRTMRVTEEKPDSNTKNPTED
jgi:hypothetical protein